jgi:hypothetical protein
MACMVHLIIKGCFFFFVRNFGLSKYDLPLSTLFSSDKTPVRFRQNAKGKLQLYLLNIEKFPFQVCLQMIIDFLSTSN